MKSQQSIRRFWCHSCQLQFTSTQKPGIDDIQCPSCADPFCELLNSNSPKHFKPYQKEPTKKQNKILKIGKRTSPLRLIQLQQILQEDQHQREGVEISHEQLSRYRKKLIKDYQCSVCRQDLKQGQQHLIFACRHAFHEECLVDWLKIKNSCPTCRQKMVQTYS